MTQGYEIGLHYIKILTWSGFITFWYLYIAIFSPSQGIFLILDKCKLES